MERIETRSDPARAAAAERYLTIFCAVAGTAGALVWLCLSLFS